MRDLKLVRYVSENYEILLPNSKIFMIMSLSIHVIFHIDWPFFNLLADNIWLFYVTELIISVIFFGLTYLLFGGISRTLKVGATMPKTLCYNLFLCGLVYMLSTFSFLLGYFTILEVVAICAYWWRSKNRQFWWYNAVLATIIVLVSCIFPYKEVFPTMNKFTSNGVVTNAVTIVCLLVSICVDYLLLMSVLKPVPKQSDPRMLAPLSIGGNVIAARLVILTTLSACASANFLYLQRLTSLTLEDLIGVLTTLEQAELVRLEEKKRFFNKSVQIMVSITQKGDRWLSENEANYSYQSLVA